MKIIGIIPARFASTRFPGKPLTLIDGKPMIQHVYEQSLKAGLDEICIATDDSRIYQAAQQFHAPVQMTAIAHESGTSRCIEVFQKNYSEKFDACINIQGDEPCIHPQQIMQVASMLKSGAKIATLVHPIQHFSDYQNNHVVKVVKNQSGQALYFSRSAIPFISVNIATEISAQKIFKHIGIYGFSKKTLTEISMMKKSDLESLENLEQLRWLENGIAIQTQLTLYSAQAIDTPEDLKKLKYDK